MILNSYPVSLGSAALHGLAGEFVRLIEPHSEADPAALLVTLLVMYGNVIGRSAHFRVNETLHHTNLFVVFVGPTSSARKGTAFRAIEAQFRDTDDVWYPGRVQSGLSSGEGVIFAVRDQVWISKGKEGKLERLLEDGGVEDKRLLAIEEEFSSVMKMCQREGTF